MRSSRRVSLMFMVTALLAASAAHATSRTAVPEPSRIALTVASAADSLRASDGTAGATPEPPGQPPDPLLPLLERVDSYMHRHEIEGITRDPRYAINPSEVVRLSVVSQLLAYNELHAASARTGYEADISQRADFLLEHYTRITSGSAFDGMLGYALLGAYEVTRDGRHLLAAARIVDQCLRLSGAQNRLNWGLMSAMALAKYYQLTGSVAALKKTKEILHSVLVDQYPDGSFAHYCGASKDVHYTAWMGMELLHVGKYVDDPSIERVLQGVNAFLERRVGADGRTSYEEPCPGVPGCRLYYYSTATGCLQDYDTRAWCNELGYDAMVFDHARLARYNEVMAFLYSLEDHGAFADKWDYPAAPWDPIYPWASSNESVIRTSVIFWSLASLYSSRRAPRPTRYGPDQPPLAVDLLPTLADSTAGPPLASGPGAIWRYHWLGVDSLVLADAWPPGPGEPTTGPGRLPSDDAASIGTRPAGPAGADPDGAVPAGRFVAALGPVTPNPVAGAATLRFTLARNSELSLAILDASGRRVRQLVAGPCGAGEHVVAWDGADEAGLACPSGLYFALLRAAGEIHARRILVTR